MTELEKNIEASTSTAGSTTATGTGTAEIPTEARDANYDFYRLNRGLEYTPEEEKRTLRKIDLQLIPLLFVIYMIQVSVSDLLPVLSLLVSSTSN